MEGDLTIFCMTATPFHDDGTLDEEALRAHLRRLAATRTAFYLGSPGAGEGHVLTPKELRRVYEIGVEVGKGRVPVHANPREPRSAAAMFEVAREAIAAGVDILQLYQLDAGHSMIPTEREQEAYWRDLLDEIDHPVYLGLHGYARHAPTVAMLRRLCHDYEQICGINVILQPLAYFSELRDALPPRIKLYTYIDLLGQLVPFGAAGALAVENNIIPETCRRIADGYEVGDAAMVSQATRELERFSIVVNRWAPSTARWVKMAMKVLGLGNGVIRKPYLLPPPEELEQMSSAFAALGIAELDVLRKEATV